MRTDWHLPLLDLLVFSAVALITGICPALWTKLIFALSDHAGIVL